MIEKRLAQWYASDAGVDLDIVEREIALTYVLRILSDHGLFDHLAFKGGTAIRKLFIGNQGRFSLDLDFTAIDESIPDDLILEVVGVLDGQSHFGINFSIPSPDYYVAIDSCGANVTYRHDWTSSSQFGIQISYRAKPLLPLQRMALRPERYFDWLNVEPPSIPALNLHEIIGEKIRAAAQRSRVRDLYDLYQLDSQRFDRDLVRRIAVIKCWETRFVFSPDAFWQGLSSGHYDWADLRRLVRRGKDLSPEMIINGVRKNYSFLNELTPEEALLAADPYQRERQTYQDLINPLRKSPDLG